MSAHNLRRTGASRTTITRAIRRVGQLGLGAAAAALLCAQPAQASEGGASLYLLGSGGPGVAVLPPIEGVFFANTAYYYDGKGGGGKNFLVGGNLVAGLKAKVVADFATVLWVPTTNLGGATLALGAILPVGDPKVNVSAVITGPLGNSFSLSREDSQTVMGDPLLTGMLGWTNGDLHIQASTIVNIPIGQYRHGKLANLAFHRWAADASLAGTWRNEKSGWDVSGKAGFTFNGENHYTDYDTGTEFHLKARWRRSSPRRSRPACRPTTSTRSAATPGPAQSSARSKARSPASAGRAPTTSRSPTRSPRPCACGPSTSSTPPTA